VEIQIHCNLQETTEEATKREQPFYFRIKGEERRQAFHRVAGEVLLRHHEPVSVQQRSSAGCALPADFGVHRSADEEMLEMMHAVQRAMNALDTVMHPHGYNFGANIGRASGAGVDNHVHFHIVPRWNGDTNFMPVLADTKVISEDMKETLKKLRKAF
jgi:hypothetical protein